MSWRRSEAVLWGRTRAEEANSGNIESRRVLPQACARWGFSDTERQLPFWSLFQNHTAFQGPPDPSHKTSAILSPPPSGLLSRLWPQHFRFRHQHARTQSSAIPVSPKPRDIARPVATSLKPSPALWTSSWAQAHCCFGLGAERTPRVKICSLFFDFQMSYTWDQFLALAPFTPCHGACSVALWLLSEKSHPISKTHQLETWAGDCQMGVIIVPTAG